MLNRQDPLLKYKDLMLLSVVMSNEDSLGFGLLVGHIRKLESISVVLESFWTFYKQIN